MKLFTGSAAGVVVVQTTSKEAVDLMMENSIIDEIKVATSCCGGGGCSSEDETVSSQSDEGSGCCNDQNDCCEVKEDINDNSPGPDTPVQSAFDSFTKWIDGVATQLEERAKVFEAEISEKSTEHPRRRSK